LTTVAAKGNYFRMVADGPPLATLLRALADPARLRVVELLSMAPRRAGELADDLGLSAPTTSKHLRVLLAAGIVDDERRHEDARVRVFRLRGDSVAAVRAWLDQVQAHWNEQLGSFRAHVEGTKDVDRHR
jgi:DNA-binding transcriptional ArsR family regulator